jgi:hypothetical protein
MSQLWVPSSLQACCTPTPALCPRGPAGREDGSGVQAGHTHPQVAQELQQARAVIVLHPRLCYTDRQTDHTGLLWTGGSSPSLARSLCPLLSCHTARPPASQLQGCMNHSGEGCRPGQQPDAGGTAMAEGHGRSGAPVLPCPAPYWPVLPLCCPVLPRAALSCPVLPCPAPCCSVLPRTALSCPVLLCPAPCCPVLPRAAWCREPNC